MVNADKHQKGVVGPIELAHSLVGRNQAVRQRFLGTAIPWFESWRPSHTLQAF